MRIIISHLYCHIFQKLLGEIYEHTHDTYSTVTKISRYMSYK